MESKWLLGAFLAPQDHFLRFSFVRSAKHFSTEVTVHNKKMKSEASICEENSQLPVKSAF